MELTSEQKNFLDECTRGTWELNSEGLVDVQGGFDCFDQGLKDFKGVRFGQVSGSFSCSCNNLTTLEGAPQTVMGGFYCDGNHLKTLEGAPQSVGGGFSCTDNELTTLVGAPQSVGGGFFCYTNNLTTLEGAPNEVGGDFICCNNNLTTLEGAPQTIGGTFDSDRVEVPEGQWSLGTLVEMYKNSTGQERKLLRTLVSSEVLQNAIDANSERAAVELKSIVHLPEFGGLRWPESLKTEVDLLSDLDGVGL